MSTPPIAGRSPSSSLRFAYVGPSLGLARAAYAPWHDARGHSCEYYRSAGQLLRLRDRLIAARILSGIRPHRGAPAGGNGAAVGHAPAPPGKATWTAGQLVRFCTEHRSFILAYGQSHLEGLTAPPAGLI